MRENPNIAGEVLQECLHQHYNRSFVTLEFLPRSQDTQAGGCLANTLQMVLRKAGTFNFSSSSLASFFSQ